MTRNQRFCVLRLKAVFLVCISAALVSFMCRLRVRAASLHNFACEGLRAFKLVFVRGM